MAAVGSLVILDLLLASCQITYITPTKTETATVPGQTSTLTVEAPTETPSETSTVETQQTGEPTVEQTVEPTVEIPVTPTATEEIAEPTPTVEATSAIFSKEYPVLWKESYTAEVGGMEIPIDIGLSYSIIYRLSEPITEIHIAEDMVDKVGDYFMHMCFWRYTQLMDHPDVTYEQYLELVAKGEGKIEVATYDESKPDQEVPEVTLIDPRKGFSMAFADESLTILVNNYPNLHFGSSADKMLMVNLLSVSGVREAKTCPGSLELCFSVMVSNDIIGNISLFGFLKNECLINQRCSNPVMPSDFESWYQKIRLETLKYENGSRSSPPFWIVQP
jgi:hypothetical protein